MSPASIVIHWIGQACFLLTIPHARVMTTDSTHSNTMFKTAGLARVLIDPPHPEVGYNVTEHSIPADAVFISHDHADHNFSDAAQQPSLIVPPLTTPSPAVVTSGSTKGPIGLRYKRIFAYHDNVHGTQRGPDTITELDANGLRIVHLGDLGELSLTPAQVKAIGRVDILMIPVGGFFTIDGNQAVKIVSQLHPRVIIPMHYSTPALNADLQKKLAPATVFLTAMRGKAAVVTIKARDFAISPATLPKKPTIYMLRYQ